MLSHAHTDPGLGWWGALPQVLSAVGCDCDHLTVEQSLESFPPGWLAVVTEPLTSNSPGPTLYLWCFPVYPQCP